MMADDARKIVYEYLQQEELQLLIQERIREMIDGMLAFKLANPPPYEPVRYRVRGTDEGDPESMFEQPRPIKKK